MRKRFIKSFVLVLSMLLLLAPASAQGVTIDFVHIFGGEGDTRRDVILAIAAEFEAQTGIKVNVTSPSTDYTELFTSALLAADQGNAPHVVQVEESLTQLAADTGLFVPIGEIATPEQLAQLEGVLPVVREYYSIGDVAWSVPWNSSNPVVYYNKLLTDLLGLDINTTEPMTFADILGYCEQIMGFKEAIKMANPAFTACINFPVAAWFPEQWVAMQNGLLANNDNGRSARATEMLYSSPEMLNVFNFLKEMVDKGYFTYSGRPNDYNGEGGLFGTGATVFHINSTAGITLFVAGFQNAGVPLGIAPLFVPSEDANNGVTVGGASLWVMGGKSEAETQAARDWVFFLTNAQNDIRWHQGSGYFPNRLDSITALTTGGLFVDAEGNPTLPTAEGATEVSWFGTYPFFYIAINQLLLSSGNVATQGAVIGPASEVRGILVEAMLSVIDGGISPEDALAAATQRANAVLADYNSTIGE